MIVIVLEVFKIRYFFDNIRVTFLTLYYLSISTVLIELHLSFIISRGCDQTFYVPGNWIAELHLII